MDVQFSSQELRSLLETIHLCCEAQEPDDLDLIFSQLGSLLPLESAVMGLFGQRAADGQARVLNMLTHNYSARTLQAYAEQDLGDNPVVTRAFKNAKPFELKSVQPTDSTWRDSLCPGNGLGCGISAPGEVTRSVISLSLGRHTLKDQYYTVMRYIAPHLHEAGKRVAQGLELEPELERMSGLTEREVEVLRWLRDGKNTWDIGRILSISERTVKFHISNVCQKLVASNRAHAVAKAMRLRLL